MSVVNYSQLIGGAMVLMQKPSMVDSPSDGAPTKAPRWDLADTEGYDGGIVFHWLPGSFWCTWVYIGGRSRSVAARGAHAIGGRPVGVGAPSTLVAASAASWLALQVLWITFIPKITLPKVSFRLDSV